LPPLPLTKLLKRLNKPKVVEPKRNTEGAIAPEISASKGKKTEEVSSENRSFELQHLGGQQLFEEDISELKEFVVSGGY
jgi:hypothetical protein